MRIDFQAPAELAQALVEAHDAVRRQTLLAPGLQRRPKAAAMLSCAGSPGASLNRLRTVVGGSAPETGDEQTTESAAAASAIGNSASLNRRLPDFTSSLRD